MCRTGCADLGHTHYDLTHYGFTHYGYTHYGYTHYDYTHYCYTHYCYAHYRSTDYGFSYGAGAPHGLRVLCPWSSSSRRQQNSKDYSLPLGYYWVRRAPPPPSRSPQP